MSKTRTMRMTGIHEGDLETAREIRHGNRQPRSPGNPRTADTRRERRPLWKSVTTTGSVDESKLLLFANTVKVWRDNTRGDYWLLNRDTGTLRKIAAGANDSTS